jgi:hypothetical protein
MLIAPAFAQEDCQAAEGEPLRLGAVFPTDFLLIPQTSESFLGADAMLEAMNACGGVNGQPVEWALVSANTRDEAVAAVTQLAGQVPLIVGSGSNAVYEGLVEATQEQQLPLWEVSQVLVESNEGVFSSQPDATSIGRETAMFVERDIVPILVSDAPRIALIHEDVPRASDIADGFREVVGDAIVMEFVYQDIPTNLRQLATEMRESKINIVFTISFSWKAEQLWNAMRRADANVEAWLMTGDSDDISQSCKRFGNTDSIIVIGTAGLVQDTFPTLIDERIYNLYTLFYTETNGQPPTETANRSASGVYVLLQNILTDTANPVSLDSFEQSVMAINSEELGIGAVTIRQNQEGEFCLLSPSDLMTCLQPYQSFPTWRNRAITQEQRGC